MSGRPWQSQSQKMHDRQLKLEKGNASEDSLMKSIFKMLLFCGIAFAWGCSPSFAQDVFAQGKQSYQNKDLASAEKYFSAEIVLHPKNVLAHYYLANTLLLSGQAEVAAKEYEQCISQDPNG